MENDYEIDDETSCPKCGNYITHYRRCVNILCEDGSIDVSDEDYLLPGTEMITCDECFGTGVEVWCPHCGHNLTIEERGGEIEDDNFFE